MFITNTVDNWLTLFYKLNDIIKFFGHRIIYETITKLNEKEASNILITAFNEVGFNRSEALVILNNIKGVYLYDSIISSIQEVRDRCGITNIILLFSVRKIKLQEKDEIFLARGLTPFIRNSCFELLNDDEFILLGEEKIILYINNFHINPYILPIKNDLTCKGPVLKRGN